MMVKNFLIVTVLVISSISLKAQINWVTFEEAIELNNREPRRILIDLYTDWCGWCKKMDRDTYANEEVAEVINTHFYAVKFNGEQRESVQFDGHTFSFVPNGRRGYHELAAALMQNRMSYPTTVFMDEQMRIIQPLPGYMDADSFLPIIRYIGEGHYLSTPWEEYQVSITN